MASPSDVDILGKALEDLRLKGSAPLHDAPIGTTQSPTENNLAMHDAYAPRMPLNNTALDDCEDVDYKPGSDSKGDDELDADDLPLLQIVFSPVADSLENITNATKSNIPSLKSRSMVLKNELLVVGKYIQILKQKELGEPLADALIARFWTYVAGHWPLDPRPPGEVLEGMYCKMVGRMEEEGKDGDEEDVEMVDAA